MLVPTIGIEVHVELKSNAKVFSDSRNEFSKEPNVFVNPIDLGYPGTLPTLNKKVIDMGLMAAIAFNCSINRDMHFDRKNYFYPDLTKGYQITQAMTPIGYDGFVEIELDGVFKRIAIERIHIEEDTCKSIHNKSNSLLDLNRAGVPLIEIVTKPVIKSPREAVLYIEKLREILLYLGISDVKIEEGSMRCDANISLCEDTSDTLGTKCEIKNIGSVTNVGISLQYEIERQTELLKKGFKIVEETRRFDDKTSITVNMRIKETGNDYRYFPEPDIPFIHIDDEWIDSINCRMPVFATTLKKKYQELGITENVIKTVITRLDLCKFLETVINDTNPVIAANILTGDVSSYLNKSKLNLYQTKLTSANFKDLVDKIDEKVLSSKQGKDILAVLLSDGGNVSDLIKTLNISKITDENLLRDIVNDILRDNAESVNDYKLGNERALKYLMGQVMKKTSGQADPVNVRRLLIECLM